MRLPQGMGSNRNPRSDLKNPTDFRRGFEKGGRDREGRPVLHRGNGFVRQEGSARSIMSQCVAPMTEIGRAHV